MKRWRRPLLLFTLLLLAGAVVNVAVAWAIAAGHPDTFNDGRETHDAQWPVARPADWPRECYFRTRHSLLADSVWISPSEASEYLAEAVLFGWPARSLSWVWYQRMQVNYLAPDNFVEPELSIPPPSGMKLGPIVTRSGTLFRVSGGRLPLTIVGSGFAINTLFYTAILALPLTFFPIRRRLRARRGRCPKCGYDRAGLTDPAAPCPECGATASIEED